MSIGTHDYCRGDDIPEREYWRALDELDGLRAECEQDDNHKPTTEEEEEEQ